MSNSQMHAKIAKCEPNQQNATQNGYKVAAVVVSEVVEVVVFWSSLIGDFAYGPVDLIFSRFS